MAAELLDADWTSEWAAELGVGEGEAAAPKAAGEEEEEAAAPAYIQGHISDKFFKRGWRMIEGEPLYHNILTFQVQDSPPYDRCGSNGCILEAPPPPLPAASPPFAHPRYVTAPRLRRRALAPHSRPARASQDRHPGLCRTESTELGRSERRRSSATLSPQSSAASEAGLKLCPPPKRQGSGDAPLKRQGSKDASLKRQFTLIQAVGPFPIGCLLNPIR